MFTHSFWVPVLALTCAVLWGWAFPLLKLGFAEFGITAEMTASKMVYAGLRFTFAGLLILLVAAVLRKDFRVKIAGQAGNDAPSCPAPTGHLYPTEFRKHSASTVVKNVVLAVVFPRKLLFFRKK